MFYTQNQATINGRNAWHYLIDTPIGQFNVVEYEQPSRELKRFIFDGNYGKAEDKFASICKGILSGKM